MPRYIILTTQQANAVRGATAPGAALDPVLIRAGSQQGRYALPERVLNDPAHAARRTALLARTVMELVDLEAWPPQAIP